MTPADATVSDRVRGLLAAIFTLLMLVGLPLALIAVGADPIPDQMPAWEDVTQTLSRPSADPTWLFIVLIAVAWGAWAVFAVSFIIELMAIARGTTAKAVHSLSPRATARGLIAAMTLLVIPAAPMTAFAMQPEVVVSQVVVPESPTVRSPQMVHGSPNQQAKSFEAHEVERGDTLWDIADEELNDGDRYDEIFRASRAKLQPDGKRLTDPDHIEPGWRLRIPVEQSESDATGRHPKKQTNPQQDPPTGAAAMPPTAPHTGEPTPQNERPDARKEQAAPLSESSPSAGSSSPSEGSEAFASPTPTLEKSTSKTAPPLASQGSEPTGPTTAPSATSTVPIPAQADPERGAGDSSQSSAPSIQFQTYEDDGLWGLRTASGVGALLAAGLGASLVTRRMIQRRHRRPGQLIPLLPDEEITPERELAQISDPLSMRRVDLALRTLSQDCLANDQPLPVVRRARLSEHQFELFLAEPAQLPTPWSGTNDGTVWTLDAATIQDAAAVDVPAPYPALVTIGHTTTKGHEAHLLVDLDYVAALGVVGDEKAVSEIIRALSLELATSVWADDLQVTAIGALAELDRALKSGRVHHVDSPQPTLDQVDRRCRTDSEALAAADLNLRSARTTKRLPQVWSPEVLVAAHYLSDDQRQQLGACVSRQPRAAISTITAHDSLGDWFLELDSDDPSVAILQPLGLRVEPQRVSEDVYQAILKTFTRADQSPTSTGSEAAATPEPSLASLPECLQPPPEDTTELLDITDAVEPKPTTGESADHSSSPIGSPSQTSTPLVKILGYPELAGAAGPIEATRRDRCLEIAAYLTICPNEGRQNLTAALWPGDPSGEYQNVRSGLLSRTRRWLGTDPDGEYWLQYTDNGECSMRSEVTTDWELLNQLLPDGPFSASDDELVTAIRMIRGRPFQGVSSQRYGWAVSLIQEMVPLLTDIAYELSTRLLTSGRWADAASVAARGLEVDELYEPLWRIQIMATSRAAGPEAALDQIQQLERALDHYGLDLEQETLDLLEELRSPVSQASAS